MLKYFGISIIITFIGVLLLSLFIPTSGDISYSIDTKDKAEETALHKASQNGHNDIVKLLKNHGAK